MRCVPASRCLDVPYEQFCRDPEAVFEELVGKLAINGYAADPAYRGPARFECADRVRMSPDDADRVVEAWKRFSTEDISP
jgi:hypothetical protein